jgi:hypothetical protein
MMPVRNIKPTAVFSPASDETGADYVFPEHIVLDEESLPEFVAEMASPRPPNAALRALFRKS